MQFVEYTSPREYLDEVEEFLLDDEVANNLPLGILYFLAKNDSVQDEPPFFGLVKGDDGKVALVTLMTPPQNIIVAGKPLEEAINSAIDYLLEKRLSVPGVIGEKELASLFANTWCEQTGSERKVAMDQRIYLLEQVARNIKQAPGSLRKVTEKDVELLQRWIIGAAKDMFNIELSTEKALRNAKRAIDNSQAYFWVDQTPVSMAFRTRPTKNGVVINEVYTPAEHRKKGYATSCVASLSKLLLDEGFKFCSLYTDLANPTSNSIYQQIGYKPVTDAIVYDFI